MTEAAGETLVRVRDLFDRGLYLQAWRAGEALGPPKSWPATSARLLGGWLVAHLGAPRLSAVLRARAFRADPDNAEAIVDHAAVLHERKGPLALRRYLRKVGMVRGGSPEVRAEWCEQKALAFALFHDFDEADRRL